MQREISLATRRLTRVPGFTALSLTTLAVGIGLVVALFSLLHGVVLSRLPYPEVERIVSLSHAAPGLDLEDIQNSLTLVRKYREVNTSFDHLAIAQPTEVSLTGIDRPTEVPATAVSPSLFDVLGVAVQQGRNLTDEDAVTGADPVVVITHALWQERFGGGAALGEQLEITGVQRTVVGILPRHLDFPNSSTQLWLPFVDEPTPQTLGAFGAEAYGRLVDGVTIDRAVTDLRRVTDDIVGYFPEEQAAPVLERAELFPILQPLHERMLGGVRSGLWLAFGAVALVLMMACANVANLFLVRAETRQREIALRVALGARRSEVLSSFLGESLMLSLVGGAFGVGLAQATLRVVTRLAPADLPRIEQVGLSVPVLLFALGVSLFVAVLIALVPGWQPSGGLNPETLRDGTHGSGWNRGRVRLRQVLVGSQVALGVVLLVAAGLLLRTFGALADVDLGFEPEGVLAMTVSLPPADYPGPEELAGLADRLLPEIEALPGVESVAITNRLPLSGGSTGSGHVVEERPIAEDELPVVFGITVASEGYFDALGLPMLEGRAFEAADLDRSRHVAIVSETLARTQWPNESAIGKRVRQGAPPREGGEERWTEVVGVASDAVNQDLQARPGQQVYYPLVRGRGEGGLARSFSLMVRTTGGAPLDLSDSVQRVIWQMEPNAPLTGVTTLERLVEEARAGTAFSMLLLLVAACLALGLGALGVYGVVSYLVALRTQEIGLRLALGAPRATVRRQVVLDGLVLCGGGIVVGVIAAVAASQLLRSLLFGVEPLDPLTFAAVPLVLLAACLLATLWPALRASRIDPAVALRWD